jgi:ATP-dependent RNA helicase RhlE
VDILVATPGRLLDLITQGFVQLDTVEILILDEADRMLDMGFIHDLRKIVAHVPRERQTLMFSATMPEAIRRLAAHWLRKPVHVQVAPIAAVPDKVQQSVYFVEPHQKSQLLSQWLRRVGRSRTLVFTRTKRGADKVARFLRGAGVRAVSLHGDKTQGARRTVMNEFQSSEPPVLVATDIAARGLDFSAIKFVVNYDLPHEPETYVHRIGRTARAGAAGCAISFCSSEERSQLRLIERLTGRSVTVCDAAQIIPIDQPVRHAKTVDKRSSLSAIPPHLLSRKQPSPRPNERQRLVAHDAR